MAEPVMVIVQRVATVVCLLVVATAFAPSAAAENLRDPTRPANLEPSAMDGGQSYSGPQLQSILIAPGRKAAVIDGQSIKLGDKFGDARLVRVTDSEVALQRGNDMQILKLFPGAEKRFAQSTGSTKSTIRPNRQSLIQRQ